MRVRFSRAINRYLFKGEADQMISSRVYVEHHKRAEKLIDWYFYRTRGEKHHCKNSFIWEKANGQKKKTKKH